MSVARDWRWTLQSDVAVRLAPLAAIGFYYIAISPGSGAEVVVGYSYVMLAWLVVDLGLGMYGTREVARDVEGASTLQAEVTKARMLLAMGASVLLTPALVSVELSAVESGLFVGYMLLRAAAPDWRLRGERRFRELASCSTIALLGMLAPIAALHAVGQLSSLRTLPFAIWAACYALMTWRTSGAPARRMVFAPIGRSVRHIRTSWSLSAMNAAMSTMQQLPIVTLSMLMPASAFAGFALLHRVVLSGTVVFMSLGSAVFPRFVAAVADRYERAWRGSLKVMLVTFGIASGLASVLLVMTRASWVADSFFPDVALSTAVFMVSYLVVRSVRIAPTRLLVADDRQGAALVAVGTALGTLATSVGVLVLFDLISVPLVAGMFLAAEVLALGLLVLLAHPHRRAKHSTRGSVLQ